MIMGCSLDEVENFTKEINKVRKKLINNEAYRSNVIAQKDEYTFIKEYFQNFSRFLRYSDKAEINKLYRVRKLENDIPYSSRKELIYPEPNLDDKDRMNNTAFRVLYTSFHEFTAMAETRIDRSFIDKYFQLTRFSTNHPLTIYQLGVFSRLHLNTPRDSEYVKKEMKEMFGSEGHDSTVQGYSALECAISDVLYDKNDGYHILSSILADAIFSENPEMDAFLYPSMQNRYGINLAVKKDRADMLDVSYSSLNKLTAVYGNGFFKYSTEMESLDFSDPEKYIFTKTKGSCCFR